MGMAVDELLADAVGHIVQVEPADVLLNGGVEDHLEENVSQFFLQVGQTSLVDGLGHLVSLLDEVPPDALVGLFHVPGTAAGMAENPGDLPQVLHVILLFILEIYHRFPFPTSPRKGFRAFVSLFFDRQLFLT